MSYAEDYHASVFIRGPNNKTVLVIKDWKDPAFWKYPGGKGEEGETPAQTAARECWEEAGIRVDPDSLDLVTSIEVTLTRDEVEHTHTKYFFTASVDSFDGLLEKGDGGERTGIFDIPHLHKMVDIHPIYYNFFLEAGGA